MFETFWQKEYKIEKTQNLTLLVALKHFILKVNNTLFIVL